MTVAYPPTERQVAYVRAIQRRLSIPNALLDNHCIVRYGDPFEALDRTRVSDLIEELAAWESKPPDMRRAQGQTDLPGMPT